MVNAISGSICMRRFYRKVPRKNSTNKHQNSINTQHKQNDINGIQQEINVQQCQCNPQFQQNQKAQHIQGTRNNLNNENVGSQHSQDYQHTQSSIQSNQNIQFQQSIQCQCHLKNHQLQNQTQTQNHNQSQDNVQSQNQKTSQNQSPSLKQNGNANSNATQTNNQNVSMEIHVPIYKKMNNNIEFIRRLLGNPDDLVIRELTLETFNDNHENEQGDCPSSRSGHDDGNLPIQTLSDPENNDSKINQLNIIDERPLEKAKQKKQKIHCSILYLSGLSNTNIINDNILKTLQRKTNEFNGDILDQIYQEIIAVTETKRVNTLEQVVHALLSGRSIFLIDGKMTALDMGTAGSEKRALDEPQSEALIRGPRLAFIESIETNLTLIRRELKDPNLRFKMHEVGRRSKQKIAVCYVEGIVNPDILDEVNRRLKTIDIDFAPDSGVIEQWIEDSFLSPFPQLLDTERPDRVSYNLMQGKVAILVDGSPFALIAPISFVDAFLTIEDFSQRWIIATSMRLLRYFSMFIALFLPGLYVALTSFHPGMLPTQLTISLAATREGGPFPAIVEVLLMAVTFEILQEASIRLPKVIGQTVGIVGGIVIGDVAVSAGIVGPALVIVTSLTAMSSFTIPNYSMSIGLRILRFIFVIAASIFGLYGIILVFIMICIHIVNLKSMGTPYSGPFAPYFIDALKNTFIRAPIMTLKKRPPYLEPIDDQKVNSGGQRQ